MNRVNTAQWRDGRLIGDTDNLAVRLYRDCIYRATIIPFVSKDENALGLAYRVVQFRDVMIRSLTDPQKHLAWRHAVTFRNIQSIVKVPVLCFLSIIIGTNRSDDELYLIFKSCTRIANGVRLSGSIYQLDYRGDANYHKGCTELVYGFMGGEWHFALTSVAGCPVGYKHGQAGAVIGAFLDPPSGDRTKSGQNTK